ncbi:MAG: hypothetical protein ACFFD1_06880 [Candidatus Thorarchaeota archaeon]
MIRKDVVNEILKSFAVTLQSFRPNVEELQLIQAKIDSMVERNRVSSYTRGSSDQYYADQNQKNEVWYKINVED